MNYFTKPTHYHPTYFIIFAVVLLGTYAFIETVYFTDAHQPTERHYHAQLNSPEQVYDGDTLRNIRVRIGNFHERGEVWPGIFVENDGIYAVFNLRVSDIDTPEMRPRKTWPDGSPRSEASRQREKGLSEKAKQLLTDVLMGTAQGQFIIKQPLLGKYAGRVVCEVYVEDATSPTGLINVTSFLLDAGLARPYDGGTKPIWDSEGEGKDGR